MPIGYFFGVSIVDRQGDVPYLLRASKSRNWVMPSQMPHPGSARSFHIGGKLVQAQTTLRVGLV